MNRRIRRRWTNCRDGTQASSARMGWCESRAKNGQKMNEIAPRSAKETPPRKPFAYRFADLTLRVGQHRVKRNGKAIELGRLTFALLVALVESAPNVLSPD